jgi:hypothetical protein
MSKSKLGVIIKNFRTSHINKYNLFVQEKLQGHRMLWQWDGGADLQKLWENCTEPIVDMITPNWEPYLSIVMVQME